MKRTLHERRVLGLKACSMGDLNELSSMKHFTAATSLGVSAEVLDLYLGGTLKENDMCIVKCC